MRNLLVKAWSTSCVNQSPNYHRITFEMKLFLPASFREVNDEDKEIVCFVLKIEGLMVLEKKRLFKVFEVTLTFDKFDRSERLIFITC